MVLVLKYSNFFIRPTSNYEWFTLTLWTYLDEERGLDLNLLVELEHDAGAILRLEQLAAAERAPQRHHGHVVPGVHE